jgi:hypothetical protein
MNKLSKLIGAAITVGLGIAIYDFEIHAIIGWFLALGYFCCFELDEIAISTLQDIVRSYKNEK